MAGLPFPSCDADLLVNAWFSKQLLDSTANTFSLVFKQRTAFVTSAAG
jgi:hypothetical protein